MRILLDSDQCSIRQRPGVPSSPCNFGSKKDTSGIGGMQIPDKLGDELSAFVVTAPQSARPSLLHNDTVSGPTCQTGSHIPCTMRTRPGPTERVWQFPFEPVTQILPADAPTSEEGIERAPVETLQEHCSNRVLCMHRHSVAP
eukprot:3120341-Rhodomonas_salina.1